MIYLLIDLEDIAFIRDCISDRVENLTDLQNHLYGDFTPEITRGERLLAELK